MKEKMKKLTIVGLVAAILCGCGTQGEDGANSVVSGEQESIVQESTPQQTDYPDYLNLESLRPIIKDGEDITLSMVTMRDSIATSDINENWFVRFLEEKMNLKLKIEEVNASTYQERRNLMFASNDLPDIILNMNVTGNDIVSYGVEGGQLLPISDYISEELTPNLYRLVQEHEDAVVENTAPDGKMYTIPSIFASYQGWGDQIGTQRIFIDTKYMQAANIDKVPETLDEFMEMLRAFKALDPAVMGVDEIWPMVSTWGNDKEFLRNAFGWLDSNQKSMTGAVWDVEKQDVVIPCAEEKYADYVKLLHTLYEEGLIHPDFFTIDKTAARALYAEGKVAVIADAAVHLAQPERFEEFVAAVPVSSQWCENGVTRQGLSYNFGQIYISADTEYPEVCMRFLDYLFSDEGSVYSTWGCPEGSEDTLGLIGGFYLTDMGAIGYRDVDSGKYESSFDYTVNAIGIAQDSNTPRDENKRVLYSQTLLGVDNPGYPEPDMSNPEDHYRAICSEVHQGHMEPPLPTMQLSEAQAAKVGDLQTVINNYVDAETAKFVVGQRQLSEMDDYFVELKALGIDELTQMCKDYYKDYIETRKK